MLKARVMNLVRRLRGLPCPECGPPRPVEWLEATPGEGDAAEAGPPEPCPRCGRIPPPQFVQVVTEGGTGTR